MKNIAERYVFTFLFLEEDETKKNAHCSKLALKKTHNFGPNTVSNPL